jgi:hypothetical protein
MCNGQTLGKLIFVLVAKPYRTYMKGSRCKDRWPISGSMEELIDQLFCQKVTNNRWDIGQRVAVPDPGKGVCADPVNGGAILGKGGPDP